MTNLKIMNFVNRLNLHTFLIQLDTTGVFEIFIFLYNIVIDLYLIVTYG